MRRAIAFALGMALLVGCPVIALAEDVKQDTQTEVLQVAQEGDTTVDPSTSADPATSGDNSSDAGSTTLGGGSAVSTTTRQRTAATGDPTSLLPAAALALGAVALAAAGASFKGRNGAEGE